MKYTIYFVKLLINYRHLPEDNTMPNVTGAEAFLDIVWRVAPGRGHESGGAGNVCQFSECRIEY